jgi:hypothetical protein
MIRPQWLLVVAAISVGACLLASRWTGYVGFPLDDAWIHQTFARNLALGGEWAFVPGQPAAGSTSPLWTLSLAIGYRLGSEYHFWTYLCGWASLGAVAWLTARLAARTGANPVAAWWAGAFVAMEWHLAWASASGMETLLFSALALYVCLWMAGTPQDSKGQRQSSTSGGSAASTSIQLAGVGLAIGLAILTRPDGLTLLPFAAAGVVLAPSGARARLITWRLGWLGLGAGLLLAAYLWFNWRLSGSLWPNTFYAKQAEYSILLSEPVLLRLARMLAAPFAGPLVLLIPGPALAAIDLVRSRSWPRLLPLGWALSFLGLYALRLPVTYQHARYLMPVIPVLAAYGVAGMGGWLRLNAARSTRRIVSRAWIASLAAATLAFFVIGAQRYGKDVAIIETEMVASARWLREATPPGALIAAHDIGAVGYFSERPILDLAGLVSPQVIPIMRDESALAGLVVSSGARYLMTFPGWYPQMVADSRFRLVFSTGGRFSPQDGGENMHIYQVAPDSSAVLYSAQHRFKAIAGL